MTLRTRSAFRGLKSFSLISANSSGVLLVAAVFNVASSVDNQQRRVTAGVPDRGKHSLKTEPSDDRKRDMEQEVYSYSSIRLKMVSDQRNN